jgi:CDP-2,3-bis-(O-geranylgeranyl)-sn-glycerol synthase
MINVIVDILYFIFPCILVNVCLNIFYEVKRQYGWEKYDKPFDFGLSLWSNRILGQSTTWGGLVVVIVVGLIFRLLFFIPPGIIIGLGCFFGHALGSFIKRRIGLPRGVYFPIVDHGDYIIVTGLILYLIGRLDIATYLLSIAVILIIHPVLCFIAYKLGFRDNPI